MRTPRTDAVEKNFGEMPGVMREMEVELQTAQAQCAAMRHALEKLKGYGRSDLGHQQMCDYVTETVDEALCLDAGKNYVPESALLNLYDAAIGKVNMKNEAFKAARAILWPDKES